MADHIFLGFALLCGLHGAERQTEPLTEKTYDIRDIVVPPGKRVGAKSAPLESTDFRPCLLRMIREDVAPNSWASNGGRATMRYVPESGKLVVCQTRDGHEELLALIQSLRRIQSLRVRMEVTLLYASPAALTRYGLDGIPNEEARKGEHIMSFFVGPSFVNPEYRGEPTVQPIAFDHLTASNRDRLFQALLDESSIKHLPVPRCVSLNGALRKFRWQADRSEKGGKAGVAVELMPQAAADRVHVLLEAKLRWSVQGGTDKERRTILELRDGEQSLVYLGEEESMPDVWVSHGDRMDASFLGDARPRHLLALIQAHLLTDER